MKMSSLRVVICFVVSGIMFTTSSCSVKRGPSDRDEVVFERKDGTVVKCFQPPDDVVKSSEGMKAQASVNKISELLRVETSINQTFERIRAEIPNLQATEVIHFRLCTDYGNGALDTPTYQQFLKVLPYLKEQGANLLLVDAVVNDEQEGYPTLELKLRNTGQEVAFLKKAQFHITNVYGLSSGLMFKRVPVSWNYNVLLPSTAPLIVDTDLSQSIQPNEVDRFTITLGAKEFLSDSSQVYRVQLSLIYNEDNRRLDTDNFLFFIKYPAATLAATSIPEHQFKAAKKNLVVAKSISSLQGVRTESVSKFIKYYEEFEKDLPKLEERFKRSKDED